MSGDAGTHPDESFLDEADQCILLDIARGSVERWVRERERIDWAAFELTAAARKIGGSFVSVRSQGKLRGCIGSIVHADPLAQTVRDNAVSAASRDPRFDPVKPQELESLSIEISALSEGDEPGSPFRRVRDIAEIQIGRDGICIEVGEKRGLLLPQVATERNWSREQFLMATCLKAGAEENAWQHPHAILYRFSAQVFSDKH